VQQYTADSGPCLDAARLQRVFRVEDLSVDHRWPEFARDAQAFGVTSLLSMPIGVHNEGFAAFNLYSRTAGRFEGQPTHSLSLFVEQAAVVLLNAREFWDSRDTVSGLRAAMESRSTIEQAVGILMAPGGTSPDDAFSVLVAASQRENRKLRDIAQDIVQRTINRQRPEAPGLSS
jgi:GAF domain-containing protein